MPQCGSRGGPCRGRLTALDRLLPWRDQYKGGGRAVFGNRVHANRLDAVPALRGPTFLLAGQQPAPPVEPGIPRV